MAMYKVLDYNKINRWDKMNMKPVIKTTLWLMCIVCLYNVFTTFDGLVFSVSGFVGMFSSWTLLRWDSFAE